MNYYVSEENGYIFAAGQGVFGREISEEEYVAIREAVEKCPDAPEGYEYLLRSDLEWVLLPLGGESVSENGTKGEQITAPDEDLNNGESNGESDEEPDGEPNEEPDGEPDGEPNEEPDEEPNEEPDGEPDGEGEQKGGEVL